MSISAIGSTSNVANVQQAKAIDGDHKTAGAQTVKSNDSDYKPINTSSSASSVSPNGVQVALTSLKIGG